MTFRGGYEKRSPHQMLESSDTDMRWRLFMHKQARPYPSDAMAMTALARAIERFAQTDGDHTTAIPALTLHRRKAPTEPLHCIYNLGSASSRRATSKF